MVEDLTTKIDAYIKKQPAAKQIELTVVVAPVRAVLKTYENGLREHAIGEL